MGDKRTPAQQATYDLIRRYRTVAVNTEAKETEGQLSPTETWLYQRFCIIMEQLWQDHDSVHDGIKDIADRTLLLLGRLNDPSLTPKGFAETMRDIATTTLTDDVAERHCAADLLLLTTLTALGYEEGVDIYHKMASEA